MAASFLFDGRGQITASHKILATDAATAITAVDIGLETFAVLLDARGFRAVTARYVLHRTLRGAAANFRAEAVWVTLERGVYGLLTHTLVRRRVVAVCALAPLVAVRIELEALAVELETARLLAIAGKALLRFGRPGTGRGTGRGSAADLSFGAHSAPGGINRGAGVASS